MSDEQNYSYFQYLQNYAFNRDNPTAQNDYKDYQQQDRSISQQSDNSGAYNNPHGYDQNRHGRYGGNPRGGFQQRGFHNNFSSGGDCNDGNNNKNFSSNAAGGQRQNFNVKPGNSSLGGGDLQVQHDTIFIQNLPKEVTVDELIQSFGAIGIIKKDKRTNQPKIWVYKDKNTGEGKGEATVTYDDDAAASAAIDWFNDKEVMGNIVKVQLATRKNNFNPGGSRGGFNRGRGGGASSGYRNDRGGGAGSHRGDNYGGDKGGNRNFGRGGGSRSGGSSSGANDRYSRPAPY